MPDVRSICAIGLSGQLGLSGHLPWEGDQRPEFVADVARFFDVTRGHVLIAGPKTIGAIPDFARSDRTLFVIRSHMSEVKRSQCYVDFTMSGTDGAVLATCRMRYGCIDKATQRPGGWPPGLIERFFQ